MVRTRVCYGFVSQAEADAVDALMRHYDDRHLILEHTIRFIMIMTMAMVMMRRENCSDCWF